MVLHDAREAQHLVVHGHVDAGRHELHGEQRFGQVLQGVGGAEFVGLHGAGQDDGHLECGAELLLEQFAGELQTIGAVRDDEAVVARGVQAGTPRIRSWSAWVM
jgi:hypothetical protein